MDSTHRRRIGSGWLLAGGILTALLAGLFFAMSAPALVYAAPSVDDPIAGLSAQNDGPALVGSFITFSAAITGGTNVSYTWDFGDGMTGSGISPAHIYTASGIYTATVTASNDAGSVQAETVALVGDVLVDVRNNVYVPADVTIDVGDRVIWTLSEGFHSVTADDESFEQPLGSDWPPFMFQFNAAGDYPYYCRAHGAPGGIGMSGIVRVQPPEEVYNLYLPFVAKP